VTIRFGGAVLKQSAALTLLYLVGIPVVCVWSLSHVFEGTVTTENAALVIVLPFAWIFGYWGVVGPLVVARRIWKLQATRETHAERRSTGLPTDASEQEIEDTLTLLAVQENPIPERWARKIVRRLLRAEKIKAIG
jgi:hypothetical protein